MGQLSSTWAPSGALPRPRDDAPTLDPPPPMHPSTLGCSTHLHIPHGGVRGLIWPVRQLLVAHSLGVEQVGQGAQLEMVPIYSGVRGGSSSGTAMQHRGDSLPCVPMPCDQGWVPLKDDSKMGAGFWARKSFLAYLLRAPLFSVGTMSWRMKRARSRMS